MTYIWQFNPATGNWRMARDSLPENAKRWLVIFQQDAPGVAFKVSRRRPVRAPTSAVQGPPAWAGS